MNFFRHYLRYFKRGSKYSYDSKTGLIVQKKTAPTISTYCASPVIIPSNLLSGKTEIK